MKGSEGLMQENKQSSLRRNRIATQQGEHIHDYSQVLIGWQGIMTCELSSAALDLSRGRFAMAPEVLPHLYQGHSSDCEILVIDLVPSDPVMRYIEESAGVSVSELFQQSSRFAQLPATAMPCVEFATTQLLGLSEVAKQRLTTQMLPMLLMQIADAVIEQDVLWHKISHSRLDIAELQRLIDLSPEQNFSNSWLAQYFNMSESHFYTVCQSLLGMSPQKYVLQRKLTEAQRLLQTTKIPVAILSDRFGFSCPSAFSRAYRKTMGQSPAQTRRTR
ncbi:MAG: AraC family transcriptional regulator [Marinomonas gallaica]